MPLLPTAIVLSATTFTGRRFGASSSAAIAPPAARARTRGNTQRNNIIRRSPLKRRRLADGLRPESIETGRSHPARGLSANPRECITAPFMAGGCTYPRRARWSKRAGAGGACGISLTRRRQRSARRRRPVPAAAQPLLVIRHDALVASAEGNSKVDAHPVG